jgi:UDP-N-acetylglucosamine 2-epimerase (non-hydrolysing)/UDP-N-acetylglucosamine 2-epimerase (hydrolysing)
MTTYLACMGTRPEIIKMAPVYRSLRERGETVQVLHTGQHGEMAHALYRFFDMGPDYDINITRKVPTLSNLTAELLQGIDQSIGQSKPDVLLVQGDTSSALVGAMVGYYRNIPVAHIEAGLRTGHHDPFPEEKNRELIGRLAHWHFPPTHQAYENLCNEGISSKQIFQVGNTVVDAALWVQSRLKDNPHVPSVPPDVLRFMQEKLPARLMLVTAHRRENWGQPIRQIAAAVGTLLQKHRDLVVVWPMHPNPAVREDIQAAFSPLPEDCRSRLCLTEPLEYPALIQLLAHCHFTLTDSGGIQEEASALRRPVLITRDSTERQELVDAGGALLVGTDPKTIVQQASLLLNNEAAYQAMQLSHSPFGDGQSASRIADVLTRMH